MPWGCCPSLMGQRLRSAGDGPPQRMSSPFRRDPHDREILRLAVPALGALVAEPLYILCDTAVVGHLGTDQLAGLAVASSILLLLYSIFIFLAYGTTAAVARLLGADAGGRGGPPGRAGDVAGPPGRARRWSCVGRVLADPVAGARAGRHRRGARPTRCCSCA